MEAILPEKPQAGTRRRRNSVVFDLTPLVDIAFLLLTFFMLSASWNTPQVMEMSLPPDDDCGMPVQSARLMTIRLASDGMLTCSTTGQQDRVIHPQDLREVVDEEMSRRADMIFVVQADKNAAYGRLIDVLDELHLAEAGVQKSDLSQGTQGGVILTSGSVSPR